MRWLCVVQVAVAVCVVLGTGCGGSSGDACRGVSPGGRADHRPSSFTDAFEELVGRALEEREPRH